MNKTGAQSLGLRFLTPKENEKRHRELAADPMSSVIAAAMLLTPEHREIIQYIRRKHELEYVPIEIKERERFIVHKFAKKEREKIYKEIYKLIGETDVHLPAPKGLHIAMKPSSISLSTCFSPSGIRTDSDLSAWRSSLNR